MNWIVWKKFAYLFEEKFSDPIGRIIVSQIEINVRSIRYKHIAWYSSHFGLFLIMSFQKKLILLKNYSHFQITHLSRHIIGVIEMEKIFGLGEHKRRARASHLRVAVEVELRFAQRFHSTRIQNFVLNKANAAIVVVHNFEWIRFCVVAR